MRLELRTRGIAHSLCRVESMTINTQFSIELPPSINQLTFDFNARINKQVVKRSQHFAKHPSKLRFCTTQWNQSPSLPAPEGKGLSRCCIGLLTHHDKLSSLVVFNNESSYIHGVCFSLSAA